MNTFILEIQNGETIETHTSGSRLELIMKARQTDHEHAELKDSSGRIIWQSHNEQ